MRRFSYILIASLLSFASCLRIEEPDMPGEAAPAGERVKISFNVAVPDDGTATKAMGLNPTIDPDGFYIAVFGGSGYFNEWVKATVTSATANYDGTNTTVYSLDATLSISDSRLRVHFIANCPVSIRTSPPISGSLDTEENVLSKIRSQRSETYNDGYWQKVILPNGVKAVKQGNTYVATAATMRQFPNPIVLVRNFARVYLRNLTPIVGDSQLNNSHQLVTIKKFGLAYAPAEGVIAPILSNPYFSSATGSPIDTTNYASKFYFESFLMNYQRYPIASENQADTLVTAAPFNYAGYSPADQSYDYYPNNTDKSAPVEADLQVWDDEHPENNVLFVYERTIASAAHRTTRIIILAERRDQNSVSPGDEHSDGDRFYALDIVTPSGATVPLLRNQTYTVHLLDIEGGSGETDISKAAKATSATVSGDPNFQDLINISDGKSSIGTSFTEMFYVKPQKDSVMFRYIPTNITDDNYEANTEGNELVNIQVGSVDTHTGIFTELTPAQASSQGILAFKTEGSGYKVYIEKDSNNKAKSFVRANNKWEEATAAQIANPEIEKWGKIIYELSESYKDSDDFFTEERTQAIHVFGTYGDREMSRNVIIKTSPRQALHVSCMQKYVLPQSGQEEDLEILIPTGLSRSVFPLDFIIEPDGYSLTPNGDALPVDYGTSICPGNNGPSYYFVKTLTQAAYDALGTVQFEGKNWKKFICHFKTTVANNACTIYVLNHYFNDAQAFDIFYNAQQRLFTNLSMSGSDNGSIYRHRNVTFSFVMDAANSGDPIVWWDPTNSQSQSSSVEEARNKGLTDDNRVFPLVLTVTLNGFTPQYQDDGHGGVIPVTSGLQHSSENDYLYYVGTGTPTSDLANVNLALTASGKIGTNASVTLSTANITENPNLYAVASSSTYTLQGASFSNVQFGQSTTTTIDLGLNKEITFRFTYASGMVVPITVNLDGLALVDGNMENNAYMSLNSDGSYTFTPPANSSNTTYYLRLKTTYRFSPCTVTLSHEDYVTASKTANRGTSFTIPKNAIYIRGAGNNNPTINIGTGNNKTTVYLSPTASTSTTNTVNSKYTDSYLNNSTQEVTVSRFNVVDDDAPVYFWYQYNNVTYYATSSLSVLSAATAANPATVRFKSIVATLTPTSKTSVTNGDATATFAKGSGSQDPGYWSSYGVGLYTGNTATISVPSGYKLTSVVIQEYTYSTTYNGNFTCSTGTISTLDSSSRKVTWTATDDNTSSVVFTSQGASGGDIDCTSFTVSYESL